MQVNQVRTVIAGSGCYEPCTVKKSDEFNTGAFFDSNGSRIKGSHTDVVEKFQQITGISERRYAASEANTSKIAAIAAENAIADAGIDRETLDQIIVAHNFGEVRCGTHASEMVPSIAARVKHKLGIRNTACVAYDIVFGCPGWLQGLIQADVYTRSGYAKNCLVIGAETLSRIYDPHDRDSMIYSDGAGAVVTVAAEGDNNAAGIIGAKAASFAGEDVGYIWMGESYCPDAAGTGPYLKMMGRKVYEFALKYVPAAIKDCLDSSGVPVQEVKKIFIHQANEKMDEAIVGRLFALYGISAVPEGIMPMNINTYGNSSVATIPTLFNMVSTGQLPGHSIQPGDLVVFASVGAGMNINAVCYRC